jgi:hypothetical protein
MDNFNEKTEFYQKMDKYYLDKPGKKPYTQARTGSCYGAVAKKFKGA